MSPRDFERRTCSGFLRAGLPIVLFFALAAHLALAATNDIRFEQLFLEEGLSQSIVECIAQDQQGFMWFGTEDGLNKYDGYRFTVLRNDPDNTNSILYNHILSLFTDSEGFIWIGTFDSGLDRYDPETEEFTHFVHNPQDPNSLSNNFIYSIIEDSEGYLWVGTNRGLNRLDRETGDVVRYLHDSSDPSSLSHNTVRALCVDLAGILWVGTDGGGLNRFDPAAGSFTRYMFDPGDSNTLSHNSVRSLFEDRSGVLWIGTVGGGLNCLDRGRRRFTRYRNNPDDPFSLSHDQVYSILEDREGTLWVGTNGGGHNKLDRELGKFVRYVNDPNDETSLSYNEVYSIYEDKSGVIWLGTYGGGVDKFDTKRKKFEHIRSRANDPNSLSHPIVWTICEERDTGILWFGTHGGGLSRFDRKNNRWSHYRHDPEDASSLSADIVRFVFEDSRKVLWVGTHGGGLNTLDRRTGRFRYYRNDPNDPQSLSHDELRSFYEDRFGDLWFGTNGGGLNRFDRENGTFTSYQLDLDDPNSLSNNFVRVIFEDSDGDFWIGTQGGGLNRMNRETGEFEHFRNDPEDSTSVSNDYVFSILEDETGFLWLGTWGGGLNRFDKKTGLFEHYTAEDGLASNSVYGALMDEQRNLWISTNNGISRFNPRGGVFKNYTVDDGLQDNEFNGNAFFKSPDGEMFFGGIHGVTAFYPHEIKDNPYVPPIVITSFTKFNKEVKFDSPISDIPELVLSHKDYVFAFEFAALDYSAPNKNQYAYMMKPLDDDWNYTTSDKRFAYYTTLPPGNYVFMVKGSNNDGIWNESGVSVDLRITPPFHQTWWFRLLALVIIILLVRFWYRWRMRNTRIAAELNAAHDAQMAIMPLADPEVEGLDVSGICIPANEVGGDFYDYISMNVLKDRFGIVIGDVSGKAMKAAMVAVMSSGMVFSNADDELTTAEIATKLNRSLFHKTDEIIYTALCLGFIDVRTKEFSFTLAGFSPPLLKSGEVLRRLDGVGLRFPLGMLEEVTYSQRSVGLKRGDVLILYTDGVTEARDQSREFYGNEGLETLVNRLDMSILSAKDIKDRIVDDVKRFSKGTRQDDDITIIVLKVK